MHCAYQLFHKSIKQIMCHQTKVPRIINNVISSQSTTYGHILISSSLDVAKPRSLLSVTTLRGSVHLDMAAGAQSFCAEIIGI